MDDFARCARLDRRAAERLPANDSIEPTASARGRFDDGKDGESLATRFIAIDRNGLGYLYGRKQAEYLSVAAASCGGCSMRSVWLALLLILPPGVYAQVTNPFTLYVHDTTGATPDTPLPPI